MIDDINTVHPFKGVFGSIKIREIIAELVKIVPYIDLGEISLVRKTGFAKI